MLNVVD